VACCVERTDGKGRHREREREKEKERKKGESRRERERERERERRGGMAGVRGPDAPRCLIQRLNVYYKSRSWYKSSFFWYKPDRDRDFGVIKYPRTGPAGQLLGEEYGLHPAPPAPKFRVSTSMINSGPGTNGYFHGTYYIIIEVIE